MKQKKTFDAGAFMRKRREELSRDYAGLSVERIEERVQQSLKTDPLWKGQGGPTESPSSARKKVHGCH